MAQRPIVIAHRGACGYLPEHTLVAKALAVGMGADYLEQDVVATRDGHLLVFHDLTLEQTTDVSQRYPGRARADGHFYCIDFDLAELRKLTVGERRGRDGAPRYPGRFPHDGGRFGIITLEEELRFVRGLSQSLGRCIGIYPEIKEPAWHRTAGFEVGDSLLDMLDRFGYRTADDAVFVQCFDGDELRRLRRERDCQLRLVQLLEGEASRPTGEELSGIREYADGIGPSLGLIFAPDAGDDGLPKLTSLSRDAHAAGLAVHPYTLRRDDLPVGVTNFESLLELLLLRADADGAFTDFPDLMAQFVETHFAS